MTTIDYDGDTAVTTLPLPKLGFGRRLATLLAAARRRRAERLTLVHLSRLDERLLRDIGLEPMDVIDAMGGRRHSVLFNPVRRSPER